MLRETNLKSSDHLHWGVWLLTGFLHHKHKVVLRGGWLCLSLFHSWCSTTGNTNKLGKAVEFELKRFNRGEFPHPFTQCNYSNRESSPTGLSSTADMFAAGKNQRHQTTPKNFPFRKSFIRKTVLLFYSNINPTDKSKIAILQVSQTSLFSPRSAPNQQQK